MYFDETKMPRSGFEVKLARLKKLKEAIEQGPLTFQDACKLLKDVNPRMIQNYLRELCELGIAIYDAETKAYKPKHLQKIVFESKADYEMALKHSKKLFLLDREKELQLFELAEPYRVIWFLAFPEECFLNVGDDEYAMLFSDWDVHHLLQHLKTGYFEEFWLPLQKYRKMMEEHNLQDIPPAGKTIGGVIKDFYGIQYGFEKEQKCNSPEIKQLRKLETYLIGKLFVLMRSVEHGTPLADLVH